LFRDKLLIKYLQEKEIRYVMRVQKRFNSRRDKMRRGSRVIGLSAGIHRRAVVFLLTGGEREMLITNSGEQKMGDEAFPELNLEWTLPRKVDTVKRLVLS
jgi:hypothetical protein